MSRYLEICKEAEDLRENKTNKKRLMKLDKQIKKIDSSLSRFHRPIGNYKSNFLL